MEFYFMDYLLWWFWLYIDIEFSDNIYNPKNSSHSQRVTRAFTHIISSLSLYDAP